MISSEQLVEQLGQLSHEKCLGVWGNATLLFAQDLQ